MKRSMWVIGLVIILAALVLSACGGSSSGGDTPAGSGLKRNPVPADYGNAVNPFEGKADAATAGKAVFTANCESCHGAEAKGDGAASASLDPKPANLQLTVKETNAQYMHWVISEGGAVAGLSSAMPAFKGVLSDDEIWQVDTYLRSTYGGK